VNDAEQLSRDPAMRWVVGDRAIQGTAAPASQMGRFETEWPPRPENVTVLADFAQTVDRQGAHPPPTKDRRARNGFEREPDLR
jgi:hypothetical protein